MKLEELIALGLTKEQAESVLAMGGRDLEAAQAEKANAESQLAAANKTIEALKKANGDNEALQGKIKEHEATISAMGEQHAKEVKDLTLDGAIKEALAGVKHGELLSSKIDRESLMIDKAGKVVGLDAQVAGLKETYQDFFATEDTPTGTVPNTNGIGTPSKPTTSTNGFLSAIKEVQAKRA